MQRIVETHDFGPHRVSVVELEDDDGVTYIVLVDGARVTDPLPEPPDFEGVVRVYSAVTGAGTSRPHHRPRMS